MRKKLDARCWKGIHVGYGKNNQWKIYNPKTRTVHLTRDVKFDENHSYYEDDQDEPEDFDEADNEPELGDFWSPADDVLLDLHPRRRHHGSGGANASMTPESMAPNDTAGVAGSTAEGEDNAPGPEDHVTENEGSLPNTPDLNDLAPEADRQVSPAYDSAIPENTMPAPRQSQPIREPLPEDQLLTGGVGSEDELPSGPSGLNPTASPAPDTPAPKARKPRGKAPLPPPSDRSTRTQEGKLPNQDYKEIHNKGRKINNVYQAKQVPKSHIHMIRALNALMSGESFGLGHVSEPLNYKQALKSPYWPEWKKAMEHEIEGHLISKTWYLKRLPKGRIVITGRWVFRIKYGTDGVILRFKAR